MEGWLSQLGSRPARYSAAAPHLGPSHHARVHVMSVSAREGCRCWFAGGRRFQEVSATGTSTIPTGGPQRFELVDQFDQVPALPGFRFQSWAREEEETPRNEIDPVRHGVPWARICHPFIITQHSSTVPRTRKIAPIPPPFTEKSHPRYPISPSPCPPRTISRSPQRLLLASDQH